MRNSNDFSECLDLPSGIDLDDHAMGGFVSQGDLDQVTDMHILITGVGEHVDFGARDRNIDLHAVIITQLCYKSIRGYAVHP